MSVSQNASELVHDTWPMDDVILLRRPRDELLFLDGEYGAIDETPGGENWRDVVKGYRRRKLFPDNLNPYALDTEGDRKFSLQIGEHWRDVADSGDINPLTKFAFTKAGKVKLKNVSNVKNILNLVKTYSPDRKTVIRATLDGRLSDSCAFVASLSPQKSNNLESVSNFEVVQPLRWTWRELSLA